MTPVVGRPPDHTVVAQPEPVSTLVRRGLGHRLPEPAAEVVREHERRCVDVAPERVEVGDAAGGPVPARRRRDDDPQPVFGVAGRVHRQSGDPRILGGDVDVEWGIVLGDDRPDVDDVLELERREGGVAVGRVGRRDDRAAPHQIVPRGTGRRVAVEVEVDHAAGAGPGVQLEGAGGGRGRLRRSERCGEALVEDVDREERAERGRLVDEESAVGERNRGIGEHVGVDQLTVADHGFRRQRTGSRATRASGGAEVGGRGRRRRGHAEDERDRRGDRDDPGSHASRHRSASAVR